MSKSAEFQSIMNSVYAGAVKECERREKDGKLVGNGHHMAQKICVYVEDDIIRRGLFPDYDKRVKPEDL